MKKFKTTVSILALVALTILNFTHAYKGYGASLQMILAAGMGSGGSGGSGDSGGTGDNSDCCGFWGGSCNERKESTKIREMDCSIEKTQYFDSNGNLVGTGIIKGGVIQMTYTGSYSTKKTTTTSYKMYDVTKINCPTDGKCNDCVEYTPQCDN